jgi:hypothetical protein
VQSRFRVTYTKTNARERLLLGDSFFSSLKKLETIVNIIRVWALNFLHLSYAFADVVFMRCSPGLARAGIAADSLGIFTTLGESRGFPASFRIKYTL